MITGGSWAGGGAGVGAGVGFSAVGSAALVGGRSEFDWVGLGRTTVPTGTGSCPVATGATGLLVPTGNGTVALAAWVLTGAGGALDATVPTGGGAALPEPSPDPGVV